MAAEKQRSFHPDRRVMDVQVEDDFGVTHVVSCSVHAERCALCQREYPKKDQQQVDFEALIKQVCEELSADVDRVIDVFERHGADMSKHKERRAARLAHSQ